MELNNIYLGDCYKLIKDIPDKSIDLVYTDIPYDFAQGGGGGSFGANEKPYNKEIKVDRESTYKRKAEREYQLWKSTIDEKESRKHELEYWRYLEKASTSQFDTGIDYSIYDEFCRVLKDIYIYIWLSKNQIPYTIDYFVNQKKCNFEILTWHKTNPIPKTNNNWLPDTEYCLFFRAQGAHRLNDGFELKHKFYVSGINQADKKKYHHPTIKPIELVKKHILHATKENDIVLDPFSGSGTTLKACQETNRRYIGFELNEEYYKIAKNRLDHIDANGNIELF